MEIALLILQVLMLVFFGITGPMKIFRHPHMVEEFERFGYPYWLARLAGVLEMIAVFLLLGGFIQPGLYGAGALLLACVMAGAAYVNFAKRPPSFGIGTLFLMLVCLLPALHYREPLLALATNTP